MLLLSISIWIFPNVIGHSFHIHAQDSGQRRLHIPISGNVTVVKEKNTEKLLINNYLSSNTLEIHSEGKINSQLYSPFGDATDGSIEDDRQFTSHRKLENLSTYHAGARFYSPETGQFIQPDLVEGPNRYAYVGNNPVSFIDPDGNQRRSPVGILLERAGRALFGGSADVSSPTSVDIDWYMKTQNQPGSATLHGMRLAKERGFRLRDLTSGDINPSLLQNGAFAHAAKEMKPSQVAGIADFPNRTIILNPRAVSAMNIYHELAHMTTPHHVSYKGPGFSKGLSSMLAEIEAYRYQIDQLQAFLGTQGGRISPSESQRYNAQVNGSKPKLERHIRAAQQEALRLRARGYSAQVIGNAVTLSGTLSMQRATDIGLQSRWVRYGFFGDKRKPEFRWKPAEN